MLLSFCDEFHIKDRLRYIRDSGGRDLAIVLLVNISDDSNRHEEQLTVAILHKIQVMGKA